MHKIKQYGRGQENRIRTQTQALNCGSLGEGAGSLKFVCVLANG